MSRDSVNTKTNSFEDIRFNRKFVALVEMHPWIYDTTHPDYSIMERVDSGWQSIVDQLGGGVTIQDCKARWRNIRGRFTKYIKNYSENSSTTPYYLASSLRFVLPFMKNRVCLTDDQYEQIGTESGDYSHNSYLFTPSISLEEVEIVESSDEGDEIELKPACVVEEKQHHPLVVIPVSQPLRKRRQSVVEQRPVPSHAEPAPPKQPRPIQQSEPATSSGRNDEVLVNSSSLAIEYDLPNMQRDCDVMFLLSLLPDFKNMNERQKRKFKAGVMNLTFDIMEES